MFWSMLAGENNGRLNNVLGRVWHVVAHGRYVLIRNEPCLDKWSFKTSGRPWKRPPKKGVTAYNIVLVFTTNQ